MNRMIRRLVKLGLLALAAAGCAKKLPPPSPDRFPPRLERVVTRSRTQFELEFDEPVEPAATPVESLQLAGPAGPVVVRGVSRGRGDTRLLVWSAVQSPGVYEVRGRAADRAGNSVRFRGRFKASERVDTIAPRVVALEPRPGTARVRAGLRVVVRLSEPADTAVGLRWFFVPAGLDSVFRSAWDRDWQTLSFGSRDSLVPGMIVSFVVPAGWRDLEGNRARFAAATVFYSDSAPPPALCSGVVGVADSAGAVAGAVVFVEDERGTVAVAAVEPDGRFTFRLPVGRFSVFAAADTDGDTRAELVGPKVEFAAPAESLRLLLAPVPELRPLDAYRR